ncbi:hypothetical protein PUV54_04880 [Hyphococcus flavus]|uniref:Ribosomal protein L7/L12 C-terminal domain-containing protein n=1 Tax=Hyphococcus flavus TaxID=1866326 RepID=A0AAE9ZCR6_9PROT|nr:hypothetical protein [Hyphococcus flavus]WDI32528.1 hypothetical protein PUV54_04880 [Hyphococcus flavus]
MEEILTSESWVLWTVLIVIAFFAGRATGGGMSSEERTQKKMEERQNAERLFAGLSPDVQQDVDARIQRGKIIEAVKVVRENSGAGLKDAKQAVDARRASMGAI